MQSQNKAQPSVINIGILKLLTFEEWKVKALREIADTRTVLEHWVDELDVYLNEPNHDGVPKSEFLRQKGVCERTRMVYLFGGCLHSQVYLFKMDTKQPKVDGEWDLGLASQLDCLLEKAAENTEDWTDEDLAKREEPGIAAEYKGKNMTFKTNCRDRLIRVRGEWDAWCRAFVQQPPKQTS